MSPDGPFFSGPNPSLIDFILAPWVLRLWIFDEFKGGLQVEELGERWAEWMTAVEKRDSVKFSMSEREYYLPIYKRYAEDKAQSELAKATRAGKGVP